jgi:hypothetical protein
MSAAGTFGLETGSERERQFKPDHGAAVEAGPEMAHHPGDQR